MNTALCHRVGIDFPLPAFSHCRDVVAAVSRSGGFGVFGASGCTPEQLEIELAWIDAHSDGRPYGVDLLIPENLAIRPDPGATQRDIAAQVPQTHRTFVNDLLRRHDIDPTGGTQERENRDRPPSCQFEIAGRTGNPARQLRSASTDAWEASDSPGALPMPLQGIISEPAMARINRAAEAGNAHARELVTYFVGQGVGLIDDIPTCRQVVAAFMAEFADALEDMRRLSDSGG
ncbi:MAG: hypothetical protein ABSC06_12255 [Rhodopila sp.]